MTDGKPTLRDVAAAAGVSPMTASNALRGKPGSLKDGTHIPLLANVGKPADADPGTMCEIGFAYGHGIPVYGYHDGLQPGGSVNLMIAQSVRAIFAGPDDLAHWLDTGEHADLPIRQF